MLRALGFLVGVFILATGLIAGEARAQTDKPAAPAAETVAPGAVVDILVRGNERIETLIGSTMPMGVRKHVLRSIMASGNTIGSFSKESFSILANIEIIANKTFPQKTIFR